MVQPVLTIKVLERCEPGELVRAFFAQDGQWAIIGYIQDANRQRKNAVVVVSGDQGPWFIKPVDAEQLVGLPCLSYGKEFDIHPDYRGTMQSFQARSVVWRDWHANVRHSRCWRWDNRTLSHSNNGERPRAECDIFGPK